VAIPTYDEYVAALSRITAHVDPTLDTPESLAIKTAAASLASLPAVDLGALGTWIEANPDAADGLGIPDGSAKHVVRAARPGLTLLDQARFRLLGRERVSARAYAERDRELARLKAEHAMTHDLVDAVPGAVGNTADPRASLSAAPGHRARWVSPRGVQACVMSGAQRTPLGLKSSRVRA
jgi:hypothetical protein